MPPPFPQPSCALPSRFDIRIKGVLYAEFVVKFLEGNAGETDDRLMNKGKLQYIARDLREKPQRSTRELRACPAFTRTSQPDRLVG